MQLGWLLFLSIFSFQLVPTTNKSLRFTIFRISYANRFAVVLTNHYQSYIAFLLDVGCSKWPRWFVGFFASLSLIIVHLRYLFLLSTPAARILLMPRWVSRWKDMKSLRINISKPKVGVKHSIRRRYDLFYLLTVQIGVAKNHIN